MPEQVCNPSSARAASQPVAAGVEPAAGKHWDGVARALLLTPEQARSARALDAMRLHWLQRIQEVRRRALRAPPRAARSGEAWKLRQPRRHPHDDPTGTAAACDGRGRLQEHSAVGGLLCEVLGGIEATRWKVANSKVEVSEAEMAAKVSDQQHRVGTPAHPRARCTR